MTLPSTVYLEWAPSGVFISFALFVALVATTSTGVLSGRVTGYMMVVLAACLLVGLFSRGASSVGLTGLVEISQGGVASSMAGFTEINSVILGLSGLLVCSMFVGRFAMAKLRPVELAILLASVIIGGLALFYTGSILDSFIALELVTFASFTLVALERTNKLSTHGGMQYLVVNAVPSGFLLLGLVLLYKKTGSVQFEDFSLLAWETPEVNKHALLSLQETSTDVLGALPIFQAAPLDWFIGEVSMKGAGLAFIVFILFGLVFKLGAAPLHIWMLDVYTKASTPSFVALSTLGKVVTVAFFVKVISFVSLEAPVYTHALISIVAFLSILIGTFGAGTERVMKRFMVYASMGHIGYMVLTASDSDLLDMAVIAPYLLVYVVTTVGFWALTTLNLQNGVFYGRNAEHSRYSQMALIDSLSNVKFRNNLAMILLVCLVFSMSAIPPFAGFFVKLDLLVTLTERSELFAVAFLVILSVPGIYYYLRLNKTAMFDVSPNKSLQGASPLNSSFTADSGKSLTSALAFVAIAGYILVACSPAFEMVRYCL